MKPVLAIVFQRKKIKKNILFELRISIIFLKYIKYLEAIQV